MKNPLKQPGKPRTCLADRETVKNFRHHLVDAGCRLESSSAGVFKIWDGTVVVYQGIQKGPGGPWIVTTRDSDNIKWIV
jgi:hypothetical protein